MTSRAEELAFTVMNIFHNYLYLVGNFCSKKIDNSITMKEKNHIVYSDKNISQNTKVS